MGRLGAAGYTLLETVMIGGVLLALLRLAIPNYLELQGRFADATAQRNFQSVKESLKESTRDASAVIFMLNQTSEGTLPAPFSRVALDDGVKVHYALYLNLPGYFDITALEVSHEEGKHLFRLLEINDKGMEQIIRKGT